MVRSASHGEVSINKYQMSRRRFISLFPLLIYGCATLPGEFKVVAKNFNVYTKSNSNLKGPHSTFNTWKSYLKNWGYAHTGDSYDLPGNEPIVASAAGKVVEARLLYGTGYDRSAESGDRVKIQHDDAVNIYTGLGITGLHTVSYHMRSNSRTVTKGQFVRRGQVIGYEGGPRGMHVKHFIGHSVSMREQANHWGLNMGYMDYWDGKSELDFPPDVVSQKRAKQNELILELLYKYRGPGANMLKRRGQYFIHTGAMQKENKWWSEVEMFKLAKHLFGNDPNNFLGTTKSNRYLISEIYANQPVILSLPLKRR